MNLFVGKLSERIDTCSSLDWSLTHQPGYPHGFELGGIDSWEHESPDELKKGQIAIPVLIIEIIDVLSAIIRNLDIKSASAVKDAIIKASILYRKCISFQKLQPNVIQDEISTYVMLKIRAILESVSLGLIHFGEKTLKIAPGQGLEISKN